MTIGATPRSRATPDNRLLTARNDGGMRTVTRTSGGLEVITDEPAARGGTGTAPTPLETVIGALCGCSGVTFAKVASEQEFGYQGIGFEATFTLGSRALDGDQGAVLQFRTVQVEARVHTAEPAARLAEVAAVAERRCPVRNLLAGAGVAVETNWTAVPPPAAGGSPPQDDSRPLSPV